MFLPRWAVFASILTVVLVIVIPIAVIFSRDHSIKKLTDSANELNNGNISTEIQKENEAMASTTVRNTPHEEAKASNDAYQDMHHLANGGYGAPRLFGMLEHMQVSNIFGFISQATQIIRDSTICMTCRSVIDALLRYYATNQSPEQLRQLVLSMCVQFQIQPEEVCTGVIDLNMDTIIYIINNTEGLTSSKICGVILQSSGCTSDDPSLEWTVDVDLGNKPALSDTGRAEAGEQLTILQITDIHHDPIYTAEGNAECGEPMCCRSVQGSPGSPEAASGYWGDYRKCDLPWHAFEEALQHIQKTHTKIDYIYMTGDIVDHAVWDTSVEKNTNTIKKVLAKLKETFPGIPVYPVLGNHEPSPLNVYAPVTITDETVSTNWLYELVAEEWSAWMPDSKETILKGGYYTTLAKPGFRIIGINNNVCYTFNWWLFYDAKDQDGQLKWLAETLLAAEKAGEKVHILGHIPPGEVSCLKTWSREYKKIVDRFEGTITAQFNGHTHTDELEVFYSLSEPTRPTTIAFNGGSLTEYDNLNSNYKLYSLDSQTFEILDGETWTYNLTSANVVGNTSTPQWYKLYSYKNEYGMESLSPAEFDKLAHRMAADKSILQKYARFFVKNADPSLGCNDDCLKNKLCNLVTSQVGDSTQCNQLLSEFGSS